MPDPDKIKNYTEREVMLIGACVVGFSKMVRNLAVTTAKTHSRSHTHEEIKQLVFSYMLWNLPSILDNKSVIRPSDIREKLPEEWKIIQYADLTDILNSFVRIGAFKRVTVHKDINKHKWGRPKKNSDKGPTGPKSFYKPTEYYNNLRNISNDPQTASLIFSLLSQSGMLYKLFKHMKLVSFNIIKASDKKKAWNILRTRNLTIFMNEIEFRDNFNKIKHADDKTLMHMADTKARSMEENLSAENYSKLFVAGGLFFRA